MARFAEPSRVGERDDDRHDDGHREEQATSRAGTPTQRENAAGESVCARDVGPPPNAQILAARITDAERAQKQRPSCGSKGQQDVEPVDGA